MSTGTSCDSSAVQDRYSLARRRQRLNHKPAQCKVNLMPSIEDECFPLEPLLSTPPPALTTPPSTTNIDPPLAAIQARNLQSVDSSAVLLYHANTTTGSEYSAEEQNSHRIVRI